MDFTCTCGHRRGQHASAPGTAGEGKCCTPNCNCARFEVGPEDATRFRLQLAVEEILRATTGDSVTIHTHVLIGYLAPLAEIIVEEAVRRVEESSQ